MASRRPKRARDPRDAGGSKSKPKTKPKKAAPKRKPAAKKPAAPKRKPAKKAAAKKASSKKTWGENRKGVACKRITFCGRTIKRCYNPDGTFAPVSMDPKTR